MSLEEVELRLRLRPVAAADANLIFSWRNRPEIVALGSSQRPVSPDEHQTWFSSILADPDRLLLIVELAGEPIGQVRFEADGRTAEISVYLVEPYTGKGLGVEAIRLGCLGAFSQLPIDRLQAKVRSDNNRSLRAFERAGFIVTSPPPPTDGDHSVLHLLRPPPVPHNRLTFGDEEVQAVAAVVRSGYWAAGSQVRELERRLSELAEVGHAVAVASGSDALRLALAGLGARTGAGVIVPAYACVAVANAALALGAEVVPAEVSEGSWNLDLSAVEERSGVVAAVAIDTFGVPATVEQIEATGIPVVEDCAHALGLHIRGRPLGGRSRAAVASFYATKLVGGGEGGVVFSNDEDLAASVREWRDYDERPADHLRLNSRMNEMEAALTIAQLDRLPEMLALRQARAERYVDRLAALLDTGLRLPLTGEPRIWYRFAVETPYPAAEVIRALASHGVSAASPVSRWHNPNRAFPVAERAFARLVSLPLYPTLTDEEQDRCVLALRVALSSLERTAHG